MVKVEIDHYEQCLLLSQCFPKISDVNPSNVSVCGSGLTLFIFVYSNRLHVKLGLILYKFSWWATSSKVALFIYIYIFMFLLLSTISIVWLIKLPTRERDTRVQSPDRVILNTLKMASLHGWLYDWYISLVIYNTGSTGNFRERETRVRFPVESC